MPANTADYLPLQDHFLGGYGKYPREQRKKAIKNTIPVKSALSDAWHEVWTPPEVSDHLNRVQFGLSNSLLMDFSKCLLSLSSLTRTKLTFEHTAHILTTHGKSLCDFVNHNDIFDAEYRQPHSRCMENTHIALLESLRQVLDRHDRTNVSLNGLASVGKTSIVFATAEEMKAAKRLALLLAETRTKRYGCWRDYSYHHIPTGTAFLVHSM